MLYVVGFPVLILTFFGALTFFVWRAVIGGLRLESRPIFEFYLLANEILRDDGRRWFGFEIKDTIERGEGIIRSMATAPPLVHFALGALYQRIDDHTLAIKHLAEAIEGSTSDEAAIVFPTDELRDYVRLLRKIERSPAESPADERRHPLPRTPAQEPRCTNARRQPRNRSRSEKFARSNRHQVVTRPTSKVAVSAVEPRDEATLTSEPRGAASALPRPRGRKRPDSVKSRSHSSQKTTALRRPQTGTPKLVAEISRLPPPNAKPSPKSSTTSTTRTRDSTGAAGIPARVCRLTDRKNRNLRAGRDARAPTDQSTYAAGVGISPFCPH